MVAVAPAPHHLGDDSPDVADRHARENAKPIFADRYRLDRMLEQADHAAVFSATDLRLRRTVSIKIVDPAWAPNVLSPGGGVGAARGPSSPPADAKHLRVLDAGITSRGTPFVVTEPAAPLNVLRVNLPGAEPAGGGSRAMARLDRASDISDAKLDRNVQVLGQPAPTERAGPAGRSKPTHWFDRCLFVIVPLVAMALALVQAVEVAGPILRSGPSLSSLVVTPTVPNLVGMSTDEARKLAEAHGMELRIMGRRATDRYPSGVVAQQAPIPGWRPESGEPLRVTVSAGVTVPELRGAGADEARKTAEGLGWRIARVERGAAAGAGPGTVSMQHPAPGMLAPEPGELVIVVAE